MERSLHGHDSSQLLWLMQEHARQGESHRAIAMLVNRLFVEVEALRAALADPAVPESVRLSYRKAYQATATDAHCSVGIGHTILSHFFTVSTDRYEEDVMMLERLGMSDEEVAATMEECEMTKTSRRRAPARRSSRHRAPLWLTVKPWTLASREPPSDGRTPNACSPSSPTCAPCSRAR